MIYGANAQDEYGAPCRFNYCGSTVCIPGRVLPQISVTWFEAIVCMHGVMNLIPVHQIDSIFLYL